MKVIFRKNKNPYTGEMEVEAFFPETYKDGMMTCYSYVGQHSTADIRYYWETTKATEEEYTELLNELKSVYDTENIIIRQKMSYR